MIDRKLVITIINVLLYVTGAALVFAWLAIRASNGGLFAPSDGSYQAMVPAAPGIEPNKSEVLTVSGVSVGVVTSVKQADTGVNVGIKITGPVKLNKDASAHVVVRNIIGERAIMVDVGAEKQPASSGQILAYKQVPTVIEASNALSPFQQLQSLKTNPELQRIAQQQKQLLTSTNADTQALVADGSKILDVLSAQKVALDNIGRRSSDILAVLSDKQTDINGLLTNTAALAKDSQGLLDDNLTVVEHGVDLAANTVQVLSRRQQEIQTVLTRLPIVAEHIERVSTDALKVTRSERGHYVYVAAANLPNLGDLQKTLETGKIPTK